MLSMGGRPVGAARVSRRSSKTAPVGHRQEYAVVAGTVSCSRRDGWSGASRAARRAKRERVMR